MRLFTLLPILVAASCAPFLAAPPAPDSECFSDDGEEIRKREGFVDSGVVRIEAELGVGVRLTASEPFDDVVIEFPFVEPLVLPTGDVDVEVGYGHCFGEGCDDQLWIVSQDGVRFLEVGRVNFLDDGGDTNANDTRMGVEFPVDGVACQRRDGDVTSGPALRLQADADSSLVLPGESREVTIDGARWRAIAGQSGRREFTQSNELCADCPAAGPHSDTFATGVLYRLDPL